jgi:hypothetical protein
MAQIKIETALLEQVSHSIMTKICHIETGKPTLRRNDAIDANEFKSIKKLSRDQERLVVDLGDLVENLNKTSPGRLCSIPDEMLDNVSGSLSLRMAYIETGTATRRKDAISSNSATNGKEHGRLIPVRALTSQQEKLIAMLTEFQVELEKLSFSSDVKNPLKNSELKEFPLMKDLSEQKPSKLGAGSPFRNKL